MPSIVAALVAVAAVLRLKTNVVVTSLTALVIVYTRSAGVAYFAAGATACALSVKLVIKRIVRQPRPTHLVSSKTSRPKKTYG